MPALQAASKLADFKPQEVANLLWAAASLDVLRNGEAAALGAGEALAAAAQHAASLAGCLKEQELSNVLWALGRLQLPGQQQVRPRMVELSSICVVLLLLSHLARFSSVPLPGQQHVRRNDGTFRYLVRMHRCSSLHISFAFITSCGSIRIPWAVHCGVKSAPRALQRLKTPSCHRVPCRPQAFSTLLDAALARLHKSIASECFQRKKKQCITFLSACRLFPP